MFLLQFVFMQEGHHGMAYNLGHRALALAPNNASVWHNIGKSLHEKQHDKEAQQAFRNAIKLVPNFSNSLEGLSMSSLHEANFGLCIEYSNRALAENPDLIDAKVNRGMAYLALKRWREGWRDYDANLGKEKNRREFIYGDEKRWDGTKGLNVICYGEQGIGDEISFASCLPDLIRDSKSVTLECDSRTARLFRRSFPTVEVHGTRYSEDRSWTAGKKFDARVALGELPRFYRNKDSDFHGKPYLKPREDMALQWKSLLDSLGSKPKIGIAWTGGIPKTGQKRRTVSIDTFSPLFVAIDAEWVSLQYKDPEGIEEARNKYGVRIHDWEWALRGIKDYDPTVAIISQLDLVISVCTTVVHAAGALGKECWCLVPRVPMWRYLNEGSWFPWASSVTMYRQKGSEWPMHILAGKLKDKFSLKQAA